MRALAAIGAHPATWSGATKWYGSLQKSETSASGRNASPTTAATRTRPSYRVPVRRMISPFIKPPGRFG